MIATCWSITNILPLLSKIKLQKLRGIDIKNMASTIKDNKMKNLVNWKSE
jgi:hypothetical protein